MKRLRRIAWAGLVSLSAILCAATIALWVRSHFVQDILSVRVASIPTAGDFVRTEYRNCSVKGHNVLQIHQSSYVGRRVDN
jgi:hypothetical protein